MSCQTNCQPIIYQNLGQSIYTPRCDISTSQRQFLVNLPAFHQLDLSTRKGRGTKDYPNRCHGEHRNKKALSFSEVLNIRKSQAYYDPKSFRRDRRS